jgi:U3 small nucleolar RNA-associated protein 22
MFLEGLSGYLHTVRRSATVCPLVRSIPLTSHEHDSVDLSSAKPFTDVHASMDKGSSANALYASFAQTLQAGLGDRVKAVVLLQSSATPRPLSQAIPASQHTVHVGFIYDEHNAFRQVDHGPSAPSEGQEESEETKRFRQLWGPKAELRRFRDGRILESVVWDVRTVDEKVAIPLTITRYLLGLHFGIPSQDSSISAMQGAFDAFLRLPESVSRVYTQAREPLSIGFKGALSAFESVVRQIKGLEDKLPLSLLQISPCSPELRYTSALAPVPLPPSLTKEIPSNAQYMEPMQLVLQFEKSAKWPDELQAIQKIKLAFFERMARDLMASVSGLVARVVVASLSPRPVIEDQARLEIITPDGWAFHIRIWHDREATLLDRILEESTKKGKKIRNMESQVKPKDKQHAIMAKETYVRNFLHAPLHHRAVAALHHRFSAYSGTVRLVKRWLASHWLLGGHAVRTEAVELLCAKFFLYPGWETADEEDEEGPKKEKMAPVTKERGFALVVEFLKDWDWRENTYIPIYGHRDDNTDMKIPKGAPSQGVWRLKTDADEEGVVWTSTGPDGAVAHRVNAIAKATWTCLQESENGNSLVKVSLLHS